MILKLNHILLLIGIMYSRLLKHTPEVINSYQSIVALLVGIRRCVRVYTIPTQQLQQPDEQ